MTLAPLTDQEIASVRQPYRAASLLPGRAYHDAGIHEFERREWFRRDWMVVGRAEDAPDPGTYFLAEIDEEPLLIARGRDGELRAFFNVCRHRGTAVVEEPCGTAVRFQCPYHAWIYDLEGNLVRAKHTEDLDAFELKDFGLVSVRMETWQGFVFVCLSPETPPLVEWLGDLPPHLARFDFSQLRVAHTETYEVDSNWKFIAENYSECYHCPGIHPQLNKLTPYDLGGDFAPTGPWQGGWMELVDSAETMAVDGGHRNGRPAIAGMTPIDERRIYYYLIWPMTFLSIHPDYLLVHRLEPAGAGHTKIVCQWLFEPATIAAPGFDPSEAIAFWDLTNRQDWHVCELQQRGTKSQSWVAGRYSNQEPSVHAFDLMAVDRYAMDGINSQRTVRLRYDVPAPKDGENDHFEGDIAAVRLPRATPATSSRTAARTKANSRTAARP
ncbi:MAG TPA: aromatic ring-hydroxylating dioxygenase subunit alpha [Candidatus Limnocylindrales bacterium]|nr:aromatic ring-hydroxylating dioxygenase subunit alpha [Candidatus Limnocylindrales bacterium]